MKRLRSILPVLLLFLTAAAGAFASETPLRISVLYFENTGSVEELTWLEKGLADMLLTDLALSEDINAIERTELQKVLDEQSFSLSGLTDDSQSIEIGRLLSAELLLTGSFIEAGGRLRIDGRLLNTETGAVSTAVKAEGSRDSIFELEAELARSIFKGLEIETPEELEIKSPSKLSAVVSYYKGLNLFDSGRYSEAVEYYRQAALEDPEYGKPRAGLEEAYRFLKDFQKMRYQREINKLLTKADVLRARLNREPWLTYADFLMKAYAEGNTDNEKLNVRAAALGLFSGETPATCAWNLQTTLYEIADLAIEYFEDQELADYSNKEIVAISRQARELWSDDPFLPELIYQELLVIYYEEKYEASLVLCEELMINYPDYRMMWAVEEFYEESLIELENRE
ncbi:MAG: CsgG/HfaB family protein [Spirochaetales bacterium]|uniref:CsgG/HfaB family protein n=1 Tax=Candidatus Thalassospirochaeta sargassi TaxID=3119039 RepID=A0AAJ1IC35_9SPIO|nr:CsgG/HfaB family protein [Spirochaetales bacterium]